MDAVTATLFFFFFPEESVLWEEGYLHTWWPEEETMANCQQFMKIHSPSSIRMDSQLGPLLPDRVRVGVGVGVRVSGSQACAFRNGHILTRRM